MAEAAENTEQLTKQQKKNKKKKEAAKKKKKELAEAIKEDVENQPAEDKPVETAPQNDTDNFDEELYWCIRQIELGLMTCKPTKDQVLKSQKLRDQLNSKKTPKPKKRMLMKQNFGNYREKMASEMNSSNQVTPVKILHVEKEALKKSVFIKKKVSDTPLPTTEVTNAGFCFNFPNPT